MLFTTGGARLSLYETREKVYNQAEGLGPLRQANIYIYIYIYIYIIVITTDMKSKSRNSFQGGVRIGFYSVGSKIT